MASNVRTFHQHARPGDRTDNHQIAHGRIQIKLAALAFVETRHGVDSGDLCPAAIEVLCEAAIRYVEALAGTTMPKHLGPHMREADNKPLQLAALAYASTRKGSDTGQAFVGAGLQALCQAAIRYAEAVTREPKSHLMDKAMLGEG